MKRLFTVLLAYLLALPMLPVWAQGVGAKKVAILEVVDREGTINYGVKLQLRSSITSAITQTPGYEAYDRVDMAAILGEHDFQRTGVVSDDQIKKLGEMSGCDYVLIIEAAMIDANNLIIVAKVVDVTTARVESSEDNMIPLNANGIRKGGQELAKKLFASSVQTAYQVSQKEAEMIAQPPIALTPTEAQNTTHYSTTTYNSRSHVRQIPYDIRSGMRYKDYKSKYNTADYNKNNHTKYSPWLAAANVIPGLGQVLCGEYGRGLIATGGFIGVTYVSVAEGAPGLFALVYPMLVCWSAFDTIKIAKIKSMYSHDIQQLDYSVQWEVSPSLQYTPTCNGLHASAGMKLTMTF